MIGTRVAEIMLRRIVSALFPSRSRHFEKLVPTATAPAQQRRIFSQQIKKQQNHYQKRLSSTTSQPTKTQAEATTKKSFHCHPLSYFTRLLVRAIFPLQGNNAQLATTSIDRALKYSAGMSTVQIGSVAARTESQDLGTSDIGKNEVRQQTSDQMEALENARTGNTLDRLREAYAEARRGRSDVWLDFADKSCYVYLYKGGGEPNETLAAFDLDGTLIKPKSNKRIPRSATDWDFFSVWTKMKLQQCLHENQARFIIFTNQNGVGLEIVPLDEVQHRIELVTKRLDIPCTVFMAVEKDIFRKPLTGMFQLLNKSFNDSLRVDPERSFYCGDAVGYPAHSDADIKFAKTLGLPFLTPDKFVRGVKPKLAG